MLNTQKALSPFITAAVLLAGIALPLREANAQSTFTWSGRTWTKRDSSGAQVGPRSNVFDPNNVQVVGNELHLTLRQLPDGTVTAAEVFSNDAVGYGNYRWVVSSINDVSAITEAVLGCFIYSSDRKELDFEAAHFQGPTGPNGYHSVQPVTDTFSFSGSQWDVSEHLLNYRRSSAVWTSRPLGSTGGEVSSFNSGIPRPDGRMKIHMNLWSLLGSTGAISLPANGLTVAIKSVSYTKTSG